jgi:hypothetical protein
MKIGLVYNLWGILCRYCIGHFVLSFARPPSRWRVNGRNLRRSQCHQMAAFERIGPDLRAVLAPHVAFQFMDRRRLRSPHDVQRYGLMRVAAKAFHFEIAKPGVDRVTERRRWLRRSLKAEHALGPRLAGEPVSLLSRLSGPLCRRPDR